MLYSLRSKFEKKPIIADLLYALFFGGLSLALGELKINLPGVEGGQTDFREIPLIISVFYIRNPLFLIVACLITSIELNPLGEASPVTTFTMHITAVYISWLFYNRLNKISSLILNKSLLWVFFVVIYYIVFLIPIMILSDNLVGLNLNTSFDYYVLIISSMKFEMVATALITGLYLIQFTTRRSLVEHHTNLELLVNSRTEELATANGKLTSMNNELVSTSEEIKSMNENLDGLVKERSQKIEDQLNLLIRYAHMNSHEVRAPLARILGLLEIVKLDPALSDNDKIVKDLCSSGEELDEIIKSMNRLLEKEIISEDI